ncbi:MAG TPA: hypothetical protein OIM04_07150 [Oscillospiraceae bacterium]|nr:hypothetical protein [Oscillospiraceae bacterium]
MILWICFTLGNIFGFRAESRSEGTRDPLLFAPGARALTPDQQDGVGKKLLLLQKNLFFQTLCRQAGKTALYPECPAAKKLRTTLALPLKSLWAQKKPAGMGELDKQMQEIVELLNSATRWKRCCAPGQSRSESADKRQICFGRGFGQDGQNLGDQIRVLPQDSKDLFICHYTKTLLFVVSVILCYNSYKLKSRGKRKIK